MGKPPVWIRKTARLGLVVIGVLTLWHVSLPIAESAITNMGLGTPGWAGVLERSHSLSAALLAPAFILAGVWPRIFWAVPAGLFVWIGLFGL